MVDLYAGPRWLESEPRVTGPGCEEESLSSTALDSPVLVLNRNYAVIHMVTCRRALSLLYRETAEVVHVEADRYDSHRFEEWVIRSAGNYANNVCGRLAEDWIFTVTYPVQVPRIIRLLRYDRFMRRRIPLTRRNVFARDQHSCQYCGQHGPNQVLTIDHIVPRSKGGRETWENIVTACARCNHKKGMRTVEQAGMKLKRLPRAPTLNPVLEMNLSDSRFESWRRFVHV